MDSMFVSASTRILSVLIFNLSTRIMKKVRLGKYKHFKGGLVEVIGTAHHSETLEEMVVYKKLYSRPGTFGKGSLWVRPKKMFLEKVIHKGKKVPRFDFVGKE